MPVKHENPAVLPDGEVDGVPESATCWVVVHHPYGLQIAEAKGVGRDLVTQWLGSPLLGATRSLMLAASSRLSTMVLLRRCDQAKQLCHALVLGLATFALSERKVSLLCDMLNQR